MMLAGLKLKNAFLLKRVENNMNIKLFFYLYFGIIAYLYIYDRFMPDKHQIIIVAPIIEPMRSIECYRQTWKYGQKIAIRCTDGNTYKFSDSNYIIGYKDLD